MSTPMRAVNRLHDVDVSSFESTSARRGGRRHQLRLRGASRSLNSQNRKRDHPRPSFLETIHEYGVKASLHDGTPRARRPRVPLAVVPHENEVELRVQGLEFQEILRFFLR